MLFRRHNSCPLASYRSAHELPSHSGFRFPSIIKPKNHQQGQDKYKPLTAGSQLPLIFTLATSRFHSSHVRDGLSQRSVCVLDMIDSASNFLVFPPAADHPLGLTSPHCPPWQQAAAFVNPVPHWSSSGSGCALIGRDSSLRAGTPGGVVGGRLSLQVVFRYWQVTLSVICQAKRCYVWKYHLTTDAWNKFDIWSYFNWFRQYSIPVFI